MLNDRPPVADPAVPAATSLRTLLGASVHNGRGDWLGRIDDAAIDAEAGVLAYALLACKDLTGITKRFVVPWTALRIDPADGSLVLDLDPGVLERAPGLAATTPAPLPDDPGLEPSAALASAGADMTRRDWPPHHAERFGGR